MLYPVDRRVKPHILKHDDISLIYACLSSPTLETVISAMTALSFLSGENTRDKSKLKKKLYILII